MAALNELIASLDSREIEKQFERYHFTESQKLEIAKAEADKRQWKEQSFCLLAPYEEIDARKDGRKGDAYMCLLRSYMDDLRKSETDYSSFSPDFHLQENVHALSMARRQDAASSQPSMR